MSLAPSLAEHPDVHPRPRRTSVLAQSALMRAGSVTLVLAALWLAVAWAVAVP